MRKTIKQQDLLLRQAEFNKRFGRTIPVTLDQTIRESRPKVRSTDA